LKEHNFYSVADYDTPNSGRPKADNVTFITWDKIPWDKIDLAVAVTVNKLDFFRSHNIPVIYHIDQMPCGDDVNLVRKKTNNIVTLYWSQEEIDTWQAGIPVLHPHPIDTNVFKGYNPTKNSSITIATRSINSWGVQMKGWYILKEAYNKVPIQVIAHGDKEFSNAKGIYSEEEMVKALTEHQLYFNCAWKLDRSPLEAMGCGMPVVAIKTKQSVYNEHFINGKNIIYANNTSEMIKLTINMLSDINLCKRIGSEARETIKKYWNLEIARNQWNKSFELAIYNFNNKNN
jgi:hypothetical protein